MLCARHAMKGGIDCQLFKHTVESRPLDMSTPPTLVHAAWAYTTYLIFVYPSRSRRRLIRTCSHIVDS
jgi:hypothetical protein